MTLAFLAARKGYLKVMGPLIQAALDRGHRVVFLRDPGEKKPGEATTRSDFRAWPAATLVDYSWSTPLQSVLAAQGAHALVGPSLYYVLESAGRTADTRELKSIGVRLYSVDYSFESVTSDPEGYRVVDVTFYQSAFQRELHWRQPRWAGWKGDFAAVARDVSLTARSAVSGSTMLDQLSLVTDRQQVRRKYGLPLDCPIVLFMSLKMEVGAGYRKYVWGRSSLVGGLARAVAGGQVSLVRDIWCGNDYRVAARSIREFCNRNGAALVVKSREKNRDPRFLRGMADVFVAGDEDVFPYTSMQLMAVADLCVHFQSGAVLEAALCGVPSVSIKVRPSYSEDWPAYRETWGAEPNSLQNFPGIVWSTDLVSVPRLLARAGLGDFKVDPTARRAYVEKYLGFEDARSSQRVLDIIERGA